jgi:hypothetical protein
MTLRVLLIVICFSGILIANAQQKSPLAPQKKVRTKNEAVLLESYLLGRDLIPAERAILLNHLSRVAAQHHLQYTRAWAEENFRLAQQLPMNWDRLAIEKNSIASLSYVNSRRAMTLLRLMDLPVADEEGSFPEDVRSNSATIVFGNYWRDTDKKGLSNIRAMALFLGQTGQYPYNAVTAIVKDLVVSPPKNASSFPDSARVIVLDAYTSYSKGSKFGIEDAEFVEFLKTLRPVLPNSLFRQGLELAVDRLSTSSDPDKRTAYLSNVHTDKGTATFHRQQDLLLFELLPTIREIDPDWATQITQRNPLLTQGGGYSGKVIISEGIFSPADSGEQQSYGLQQSRAQAAGDLAQTSPEKALQLAQTISNQAIRTVALANIACAVGKSAPESSHKDREDHQ